MLQRIHDFVGRFHAEQSGAIALLLLASMLILLMTSLIIYDAGQSAQDKMDTQIGADSAAYSHTVVKARSMNMIAYANTIKRMIFSYLATYVNAWLAILARWAYHASRCFRIFPDISSCITWGLAIPMIIAEGIEFIATNGPAMGAFGMGGQSARSVAELKALENYSQYMFAITPWWAYVEGVSRGITNGAMITGAWPPPGSVVTEVKAAVASIVGTIDSILGTNVMGQLPSFTTNVDVLPINRRDRDSTWLSTNAPYLFPDGGSFEYDFEYCRHYAFSLEALTTGAQTYLRSYEHPRGWKNWFAPLQLTGSVGCFFAAWNYRTFAEPEGAFYDWRIKKRFSNNRRAWASATSSLHIAYTPRAGRNSDTGGRRKYGFLSQEAQFNKSLYANEGYFAMARSELVYKQPFDVLNSVNSFFGGFPGIGNIVNDRLGIQHEPDMWSPRWKTKNRPVMLPGETFGSAIQGTSAGLNTVINDTVPFLALGSLIGLVPAGNNPPFSIPSAVKDFAYLLRVGQTFQTGQLQGLVK